MTCRRGAVKFEADDMHLYKIVVREGPVLTGNFRREGINMALTSNCLARRAKKGRQIPPNGGTNRGQTEEPRTYFFFFCRGTKVH